MNDNQFSALLAVIVPQIIELIATNSNLTYPQIIERFYSSRLYSELASEETKLWRYSPRMLYSMYQDELLSGSYDYPEEAG